MAILTKPKFYAQERLDLEDVLAWQSADDTDSKLWTKEFLSNQNYILKGFEISGLGLNTATISMADATFIIGGGTSDFSYYISAPSQADLILGPASFVISARNYLELSLEAVDETPIVKTFWDPSANSGAGAEFNQTVNTMTDLQVAPVVLQGGFSGLPDRLPVAIIDVDGSGTIRVILDQRYLFFRLGIPGNPGYSFPWNSQTEPAYAVNITSPVGTFVVGETVTFSGGATATVSIGGTTNISVVLPSGVNFTSGNTITGGTSGATGTVNTIIESFVGSDKDIMNLKQKLDALSTEIKRLKGTYTWPQIPPASIAGLSNVVNSVLVQESSTAKFIWTGGNLSITDSNGSPLSTDILGELRTMGMTQLIKLARADGQAGTSTIPIPSGSVLFIQLPASGNRTYSGNGSGASNYQVVPYGSFVQSDSNYWLAYNENGRLAVRGQEALINGESADIGDDVPASLLANIGLLDEVTPAIYTSTGVVTQGSSLVAAISALDAVLGASSYSEFWTVVSGTPGAGQINPVTSGSDVTIPLNSRLPGSPQQFYVVGKGNLEVRLNGLVLDLGVDWNEVGSPTSPSDQIEIMTLNGLTVGDKLEFRLIVGGASGGGGGGGGGGGNLQDAYNAGNDITTAPNSPFTVISGGGKAAQFDGDIGVTGVIDPAGMELTPQSSNPLAANAAGIWVDPDGNLMSTDGETELNITQTVQNLASSSALTLNLANNTGSSIPANSAVYVSSAGNISLASCTNLIPAASRVIGVTTAVIANGSLGPVAIAGYVINAGTGMTQGAYAYLSDTPGGITMTPPSTPGYESVIIGVVDGNNLFLQIQNVGTL